MTNRSATRLEDSDEDRWCQDWEMGWPPSESPPPNLGPPIRLNPWVAAAASSQGFSLTAGPRLGGGL